MKRKHIYLETLEELNDNTYDGMDLPSLDVYSDDNSLDDQMDIPFSVLDEAEDNSIYIDIGDNIYIDVEKVMEKPLIIEASNISGPRKA